MNPTCEIIVGDCLGELRKLPADSVHCVVTSPPYDDLRVYGGTYTWDYATLIPELVRVLVPGGVIVWVIGDEKKKGSETGSAFRQALAFMNAGMNLHDTMIWQKPNFSHPARNSYHQVFDFMFVFSKGAPRVFNPIKDRKNRYAGKRTLGRNTVSKRDGTKGERAINEIKAFGMRHNVWLMNTTGQERPCAGIAHPATYPERLAADHIRSWSNPGDTILDPFLGSGTTCLAALKEGRNSIGIEIFPEYAEIARGRCNITPGLQLS